MSPCPELQKEIPAQILAFQHISANPAAWKLGEGATAPVGKFLHNKKSAQPSSLIANYALHAILVMQSYDLLIVSS